MSSALQAEGAQFTEGSPVNYPSPILIYGDSWPMAYAVNALCGYQTQRRRYYCDTLNQLSDQLQTYPDAPLILCLSPHEHVYLFYAISPLLDRRRAIVVADTFYYSDRVLLDIFGYQGRLEAQNLRQQMSNPERHHPVLQAFLGEGTHVDRRYWVRPSQQCSPSITRAEQLITLMTRMMMCHLHETSLLRPRELMAIKKFWEGKSVTLISNMMGLSGKSVSGYKISALNKLDMRATNISLYRGGPFKEHVQRTPFMTREAFKLLAICSQHWVCNERAETIITGTKIKEINETLHS